MLVTAGISSVHAEVGNSSTWKNTTLMNSSTRGNGRVGGLGFMLLSQNDPAILLQGGLHANGFPNNKGWVTVSNLFGITLGSVSIPGGTPLQNQGNEETDWAHNKLIFSNGTAIINTWISRLTPAVLIQSQNTASLGLFTGSVFTTRYEYIPYNATKITNVGNTFSSPKYIAYQTGTSQWMVKQIDSTGITMQDNSTNWALVWYGLNSHFTDTKVPTDYTADGYSSSSLFAGYGYQADAPVLLTFGTKPTSLKKGSNGGIEMQFTDTTDHTISLLPLFGREHLNAVDTENWGVHGVARTIDVPLQNALTRAATWAVRMCEFPVTIDESYEYTGDTSTITETIPTWIQVCPGGKKFMPIPPMLALAKEKLPIAFSPNILIDGDIPTEFGPVMGIEDTDTYTWSLSGMKRFTDSKQILTSPSVPSEASYIVTRLTSEVDKLFDPSGNPIHFEPWAEGGDTPNKGDFRGGLYFLNPADTINSLTEILTALPQGDAMTKLQSYINNEIAAYPPQDIYQIPFTDGERRGPFSTNEDIKQFSTDVWDTIVQYRKDILLKRVSLYNFYPLARYYEISNDSLPSDIMGKATTVFNKDMSDQDWATMYWLNGYEGLTDEVAVTASNRFVAGILGYIKTAQLASDTAAEQLGRAVLAKALVQRIGMDQYPAYYEQSGLTVLPKTTQGAAIPGWQPDFTAARWVAPLFNYSWNSSADDARLAWRINGLGVRLGDFSGSIASGGWDDDTYATQIGYRDMVPHLAYILSTFEPEKARLYLDKATTLIPNWYAAFSEGVIGNEHNINRAVDSYQLFMAKAWIEKDAAQNLEKYIDIPWLSKGDLFYMQKLAETIKAYRGWCWSIDGTTCDDGSVPSITGDLNGDLAVNIQDIIILINEIFTPNGVQGSDINSDGKVDILDVISLINIIFK